MNTIFSLSANSYGLLTSKGICNFVWQSLASEFILPVLVCSKQFAWFLFCFLWVWVCIPSHVGDTGCHILWWAQKHTLLQAFMSGRVSIVYWGDHRLKASIHIFSFWKMLYNNFLAMHISFQKLLTIAAMINLSNRTRSWVMAPVGPRQEEWSWAGLLNSWALLFFFFKWNLYVKLPIYALNSHTEFRKWILFQDELAWEYLSEVSKLF